MRKFGLAAIVAAALAMPRDASAQFPVAPFGTEGLSIFVNGNNPIVATYLGNSASFSNNLYLMLDAAGNPGDDGNLGNDMFLFNNQSSLVGSTVNLGAFGLGTELIFRLFVQNTGEHFLTGPGIRNPDGLPHARVQNNWQPQTTLVSFEDLLNLPEYPDGFNDLSFSFTNTSTAVVPEPSSVALVGLGVVALFFVRRRRAA